MESNNKEFFKELLKLFPLDNPSIYDDKEENEIELYWDNKKFTLLINYDHNDHSIFAILRLRDKKNKILEFDSKTIYTGV